MSTPVRLYGPDGVPMAVQDGVAIPANTSSLLVAGKDENSVARTQLVESKANSTVGMEIGTYGARFSPYNAAFTTGAPIYTRTSQGHIATAAVTQVKIVEANSTMGMFLSASAASSTFVVASASANDATAGTGIRTINIVYIGRDGLRYTVAATMNGVSNVTVNLNPFACGVEQVYATSVGTGLAAAGIITVKNTGGATTMGQINTGNTRVVSTEQIAQIGKTLYLRSVRASAQTTACLFRVVYFSYDYVAGSATGAQTLDIDGFRMAVGSEAQLTYDPPIALKTPAAQVGRLWVTVTPDAVTASNYWASMDTFEVAS